jgi:hypothetical protein
MAAMWLNPIIIKKKKREWVLILAMEYFVFNFWSNCCGVHENFWNASCLVYYYYFNHRCSNQFSRIIINFWIYWTPYKFNKQIKHYEDGKHTHWHSNPRSEGKQTLSRPLGQKSRASYLILSYNITHL